MHIMHTCMCILRAISRHVQMLSEGICAISCQGVGVGEMLGWIGYGLDMLGRNIYMCILENIAAHYMIRLYIALQHSSRLLIARNKERDVVTLHVCVFASCSCWLVRECACGTTDLTHLNPRSAVEWFCSEIRQQRAQSLSSALLCVWIRRTERYILSSTCMSNFPRLP